MRGVLMLLALLAAVAPAAGQPLRIGLKDDPDILDPTLARTFASRTVFIGLCDKLFDVDDKLGLVPQLATGWSWADQRTLRITLRPGVTFHDGRPMDAEAVRHSLHRHLTMQGSFRRGELTNLQAIEVVDPLTILLRLDAPSGAFLSQLSDRAGMILSPAAVEAAGRDFGRAPVCAGPFRFVERIAQDRIVLDRFPQYWDAARIHIPRVTFQAIPDNTARRANLQAGALDVAMQVEPDDVPALRRNARLRIAQAEELGYQVITFNIANGPRSRTPFGQDARIRAAFEAAIDRQAINQVVYGGQYSPTVQPVPPASPYHLRAIGPVPGRDLDRARALLREAGATTPVSLSLTVPNSPDLRQVGEMIQAMVREAGFDLRLNAMEYASGLAASNRGDFEASLTAWSGRPDPDGNIYHGAHSRGATNEGKYADPEVDRLLDAARAETDPPKRLALYDAAWRIAIGRDRSRMYLWHRMNITAYSARVRGLQAHPDGLIRLQDVRLD
jgi:peptide/nickel transport system substrate-binding protein